MLANPKRLIIIDLLARGEKSVGEIAEILQAPLATASRHLSLLKAQRVVEARKEGHTVYYRLRDTRIIEACRIIRDVLLEDMKERGRTARALNPDTLIK